MSWFKKNTLLIINFCVLGLFLWLTVSFLVVAISEREQAKQLLSSAAAQASVYDAAQAFTRDQESTYYASQNMDKLTEEDHGYYANEKKAALDAALDAMSESVASQINRIEFNARIRSSRESIQTLSASLTTQMSSISDSGKKTRAGFALQDSSHQQLGSVDRDLSFGMSQLSGSLSYMPNRNAAQVSVLQSLVASATKLRMDLSQLKLEFWKYAGASNEGQHTLSPHLLSINDTVLRQLETMVLLSNSSVINKKEIHGAQRLRSLYLSAVLSGKTLFAQPYERVGDANEFGASDSLNVVVQQLDLIVSAAIVELRKQANSQVERATRNSIIDIILMCMCLLIASTLFMLIRRTNHLAYNNQLTGLLNRVSLEQRLSKLNDTSSKEIQALIYIDLDRFKAVNDNYGHEIGDEIIRVVANRLEILSGPNAVVFCLGGDEFAVLVKNIESEQRVLVLANQLLNAIREDILVRNLVLRVGASAGVSLSSDDNAGGLDLLKNADVAMYQCKKNKQEQACRFNSDAAKNYQSRLDIEIALKEALKNGEFQLFYQPKVCTKTGSVGSVEALLRWVHKDWGVVSPGDFIPIAEDLGLMVEIGNWVLDKACMQITEFQHANNIEVAVAVNVSPQQFGDQRFEEHVFNALQASTLENRLLELEITESVLLDDTGRVISVLSNFRQEGIKVALDDFGTGYSSLQYLQKLPLDVLKIDRAFILATDGADPENSVANTIVQLANLFNLETVAEGIETKEQDDKLRSIGVDYIQGYRYSKPVPVEQLADVIRAISNGIGPDSNQVESLAA